MFVSKLLQKFAVLFSLFLLPLHCTAGSTINEAMVDDSKKILSKEVLEQSVIGKMFFPNSTEPRPGIIVFSGSDGGFHEHQARRFAEAGYVALALAFFNADHLPANLENIPLEYFLNGIRWFKSQPQVRSEKIHLYGPSRGGELALLLGSVFPKEISSIIAIVPSCVTFGGIPNEKVSSWTLNQKPLPFAPTPGKEDVCKQLESRMTVNLGEIYLEKMKDSKAFEQAMIEVEKIECPLLLISGNDDKMWPSWIYSDLIMQRLDRFSSKIYRKHLCYDKVGHMITHPCEPVITTPFKHPVVGLFFETGGDPEAQSLACKESWQAILQFLEQSSK